MVTHQSIFEQCKQIAGEHYKKLRADERIELSKAVRRSVQDGREYFNAVAAARGWNVEGK